jgi:BMFP domain-containing protein YqiC
MAVMSHYRSELDVLRLRIEELEDRLREVRRLQREIDAASNLGPEAPHLFSRQMYRLGRALGRILRRRGDPSIQDVQRARARVEWLSRKLSTAEHELTAASANATPKALFDLEPTASSRREPSVLSLARSVGRFVGRMLGP